MNDRSTGKYLNVEFYKTVMIYKCLKLKELLYV